MLSDFDTTDCLGKAAFAFREEFSAKYNIVLNVKLFLKEKYAILPEW